MTTVDRDKQLGENFNPQDVFSEHSGWVSIDYKTDFMGPYVQQLIDEGFIMREALGPHANRMNVKDPLTKSPREVVMLGSNNYLGLANEAYIAEKTIEAIKTWGTGIGGPPLFNGTTSLHRELEKKLAKAKGTEDAIIFSSGYSANVGWTTALLDKGDYLVYDELSHASLFDGIKMGNFRPVSFIHDDFEDLRRVLMKIRYKRPEANIVVCVEGVYSMEGSIVDLPTVSKIVKKYGAYLALDDAHGFGVTGERGHGTQEHFDMAGEVDIIMGTFSKTLAATGGFIAAKRNIVNYLRAYSRPYFFSASMPPSLCAQIIASLEFLDNHPERVKQLWENVKYFAEKMQAAGFSVDIKGPIIPIHVPEHINVRDLSSRLHHEGVYVNGVAFPAVPASMQRLRISLMATLTQEDMDFAVGVLQKVCKELGVI